MQLHKDLQAQHDCEELRMSYSSMAYATRWPVWEDETSALRSLAEVGFQFFFEYYLSSKSGLCVREFIRNNLCPLHWQCGIDRQATQG